MRLFAVFALLGAVGPPTFGIPGQEARALVRAHPRPAHPNGSFALEILLELPPGWHVQSERPLDEFLIPTIFVPAVATGVEWGSVEYPPDTILKLDWSESPISVYEGLVVMVVRGQALGEPPGSLGGSLTYQACTDEVCFPPRTVELAVEMEWDESAPSAPVATLAASQDGEPGNRLGG
ncbi:hypothetical protein IIA16_03180, partial [bacterium]|nr:hypothetical protein [bacterium]